MPQQVRKPKATSQGAGSVSSSAHPPPPAGVAANGGGTYGTSPVVAAKVGGSGSPRPNPSQITKGSSPAAAVAGAATLISETMTRGADAASYAETCSASIDRRQLCLVWDWTMLFFMIVVIALIDAYFVRKMRVLVSVIDDVDERPNPAREELMTPRAKGGCRTTTYINIRFSNTGPWFRARAVNRRGTHMDVNTTEYRNRGCQRSLILSTMRCRHLAMTLSASSQSAVRFPPHQCLVAQNVHHLNDTTRTFQEGWWTLVRH